MGAVGGPVESISIDGRNFPVAGDADVNLKVGGFENEMQPNGDGTARQVKTRVPWGLDSVTLSIDHDRDDMDFLQQRSDAKTNVAIGVTFCSGDTFSGTGTIVGEIKYSSAKSTAEVGLGGPGKMEKQ